jgi:hypothetical protein
VGRRMGGLIDEENLKERRKEYDSNILTVSFDLLRRNPY